MTGTLGRIVVAAVIAGAAELVVLRLLTRTAIHIPGLAEVAAPYAAVAALGRYAYYAAAVLVLAALCTIAWTHARGRTTAGVAIAAAVTAFLGAAGLARIGLFSDPALGLVTALVVASLAVVGVAAPGRAPLAERASLMLFASAFLASLVFATGASATAGALAWLLPLADLLVVAWALSLLPLAPRGLDRAAAMWAVAAAVVVFAGLERAEATVKILFLWNFGVGGLLPSWTYALAFGALAYAVVALASARRSTVAFAIGLLVLGGIGLHSTYQSALVVAGLALLAADRVPGTSTVTPVVPVSTRRRGALSTTAPSVHRPSASGGS